MKMIPYSVYLPEEYHKKLRKLAAKRQASAAVRDAIILMLSGSAPFGAGYQKGIGDAVKLMKKTSKLDLIIDGDQTLKDRLIQELQEMKHAN